MSTTKLYIPKYNRDESYFIDYDQSLTNVDEIYFSQCFNNKVYYTSPFHNFYESDIPFVEVTSYRNSQTDASLVSLMGRNQELFEFYCTNLKEELDCVQELLEIAVKLIQIEKSLKKLVNDADDS